MFNVAPSPVFLFAQSLLLVKTIAGTCGPRRKQQSSQISTLKQTSQPHLRGKHRWNATVYGGTFTPRHFLTTFQPSCTTGFHNVPFIRRTSEGGSATVDVQVSDPGRPRRRHTFRYDWRCAQRISFVFSLSIFLSLTLPL